MMKNQAVLNEQEDERISIPQHAGEHYGLGNVTQHCIVPAIS